MDHILLNTKQRKAKLVGLYTHGKKGVGRFFLGSFAETAVHRSKIDLLLVSPKSKFSSQINNIFLASDFSSESKKEVLKAIRLCKQLKAKLTIFYAARVIYKWSLDETSSEIKKYRTDTDKMASWVRKACLKKKLKCNVIVDTELKPISERALFHAKRSRAKLIIVSARVGAFTALMGGSITRQILRNGTLPVLVMKCSSSSKE